MATVKQKIAVKQVLKGIPITRAMKMAGYAETTSNTTSKLTASKGWAELVDRYISDESLAKVHRQGLGATSPFNKIVGRDSKGAPEYALIKVPDYSTRHRYLESGYKLRGRYVKESEGTKILIVNITDRAATKYGINESTGGSGQ